MDIMELRGDALIIAIQNMREQLASDDNDFTLDNITLDDIIAEIDSLNLTFTSNGKIII
jgi:hypothetical protein